MNIKISDMKEYQQKILELKQAKQFTAGNFKSLGRELRDKFRLTDMEAIDILNGKHEAMLKILERQEMPAE